MASLYKTIVASALLLPALAQGVSHSGNGCPQGSPVVQYGANFDSPRFCFSQFSATAPGDGSTTNCEVHLTNGQKSGVQYAVSHFSVDGEVTLKPNTRLSYFFTYFWSQDADDTSTTEDSIVNNSGQTVSAPITISRDVDDLVWGPCGGDILNVNFRVAFVGGQGGWFNVTDESIEYATRKC